MLRARAGDLDIHPPFLPAQQTREGVNMEVQGG